MTSTKYFTAALQQQRSLDSWGKNVTASKKSIWTKYICKIDLWSKALSNLSASNERLCPATLAQSSFTATEMAGKSVTTDYLGLDDACQWTAQPLTTLEPAAPTAILTT